MSIKTICNLKEGEKGVIVSYNNDKIAGKLLSMGVLPGKTLRLIRRSLFGGGLYLKMEDHIIALRKDEANHIFIEEGKEEII